MEHYLNECIQCRLIPYICTNYKNGNYVFWPDQASAHYAKSVLDTLIAEKINFFVAKEDNPVNVPEIRPVEDFWAILKGAVCTKGWKAKNCKNKLEAVCQCLKTLYKYDLELIEIQWQKFNVSGSLEMDVFYNQKIIIEDKKKKLKTKVENFDHLFSSNRKRVIITADAGYGKSTFVHEMARQWVKGQSEWTKKFLFVFLIRLSEISQNKTQSLQTLLTMCFNTKESLTVNQWLEDSENMEKCLFIFDGLDELRQEFCKEIKDLIFGRGVQHAHVVVTFRPSEELEKKFEDVFCNNLYIELKGYTEDGVKRQLEKFKINPKSVGNDLKDVLKVPLFNTLFCITHKETTVGCLNISNAIEKFVKFACNRHRETNPNFSEIEENEIVTMLGQAAQNKFSLMKGVNIEYPNVTPQHLYTAVKIGLVSKKSTNENFVFAHQSIAEYCAAYFWVEKEKHTDGWLKEYFMNSGLREHSFNPGFFHSRFKDWSPEYNSSTSKMYPESFNSRFKGMSIRANDSFMKSDFAEPEEDSLMHIKLFSCFLSHLDDNYKLFLWQNFKHYVPLLDEYESLPKRQLEENEINLRFLSVSDQNRVMEKIKFSVYWTEDNPLKLSYVKFESGKIFEGITKMEHLYLYLCSFEISPEEFFRSYNIKSLVLDSCTYNDWNPIGEDYKEIWKNDLVLEYLIIEAADLTVMKFLSFIMRHCTTLKAFKLCYSFESFMDEMEIVCNLNYSGDDWISNLDSNEKLILSIEHFELDSAPPIVLTNLFETMGRMVNLNKFNLTVKRKLMEAEINSLSLSFENGLKNLKKFTFDLNEDTRTEISVKNKGHIILGSAFCDACHNRKQRNVNVRFICISCPAELCENCQEKGIHDYHDEMIKYISSNAYFWRKAL